MDRGEAGRHIAARLARGALAPAHEIEAAAYVGTQFIMLCPGDSLRVSIPMPLDSQVPSGERPFGRTASAGTGGAPVSARGLPKVMSHALRHSHASALIAGGLDILTISRRLGHGSPVVTLNTHAHLFERTDTAAATAIEAAMRTGPERQSVLIARCGTSSVPFRGFDRARCLLSA